MPTWLFYYGGAAVLIASFVALGVLWRRPVLEPRRRGRPVSGLLAAVLLSTGARVVAGALGVALLVVVWAAALVGEDSLQTNLAPTFVWVLFWIGLVPACVLLGDVWGAVNPWRAVADLVAAVGPRWTPRPYPELLGRFPAALLLFAFAALELAYPDPAQPRVLAVAIAVYSAVTWAGMAVFGRRAWLENGEAFSVYFGLVARIAPLAVVDGRLVLRPPLAGLAGREERRGTVAFVAVMLGVTAFDGFTRTGWWQDRVYAVESRYAFESLRKAETAVAALDLAGLTAVVLLVGLLYLAAAEAARLTGRSRGSLAPDFVGSLVPIAVAYVVAHYFSLFVIQGQVGWRLVSDPLGRGWDLFGTAGFTPNLGLLTPNLVWYVQVGALVAGHVLGLALAHERAVSLYGSAGRATRTQLAMLALMVLYTVGGMWILSQG